MKKWLPKNKTKERFPSFNHPQVVIDFTDEQIKEWKISWLKYFDKHQIPFIAFIEKKAEYLRAQSKVDSFINEFLTVDFPISKDFDLHVDIKYAEYLKDLIVDGKYRGFIVKYYADMPENYMYITASQKPD
jgi:hypothetical protein